MSLTVSLMHKTECETGHETESLSIRMVEAHLYGRGRTQYVVPAICFQPSAAGGQGGHGVTTNFAWVCANRL